MTIFFQKPQGLVLELRGKFKESLTGVSHFYGKTNILWAKIILKTSRVLYFNLISPYTVSNRNFQTSSKIYFGKEYQKTHKLLARGSGFQVNKSSRNWRVIRYFWRNNFDNYFIRQSSRILAPMMEQKLVRFLVL